MTVVYPDIPFLAGETAAHDLDWRMGWMVVVGPGCTPGELAIDTYAGLLFPPPGRSYDWLNLVGTEKPYLSVGWEAPTL